MKIMSEQTARAFGLTKFYNKTKELGFVIGYAEGVHQISMWTFIKRVNNIDYSFCFTDEVSRNGKKTRR